MKGELGKMKTNIEEQIKDWYEIKEHLDLCNHSMGDLRAGNLHKLYLMNREYYIKYGNRFDLNRFPKKNNEE